MKPGDFLLVESRGTPTDRLISFGQWIRRKDRPYRRFVHAALIIDEAGTLIEAEPSGIHMGNTVATYPRSVVVNITAPDDQRANAVAFAKDHLADHYGFLTFGAIGVQILTGVPFQFGLDGTEICSAYVSRALERCGYNFVDPFTMTPADLACQFHVLAPLGSSVQR